MQGRGRGKIKLSVGAHEMSVAEQKNLARKSDVEKKVEKGIKVTRKSRRDESRISTLSASNLAEKPPKPHARWTRHSCIQNFKEEIKENVGVRLATDIPVTRELFYHLLDQLGVPPKITNCQVADKQSREERLGQIDSILASIVKGKQHIDNSLPYEMKRGKKEEDVPVIYSYTAKIAEIESASEIKQAISQITSQEISDPDFKEYKKLQCDDIGISYNHTNSSTQQNPYFNFEIKFSLKKDGDSKPELVTFHTGEHAKRGASLNIHVKLDRAIQGAAECKDVAALSNKIAQRIAKFSTCFFSSEYKVLNNLGDFDFVKGKGKGNGYHVAYNYRGKSEARYFALYPLKENDPPPPDKAPKEKVENKELNRKSEDDFPLLSSESKTPIGAPQKPSPVAPLAVSGSVAALPPVDPPKQSENKKYSQSIASYWKKPPPVAPLAVSGNAAALPSPNPPK